MTSGLKNNKKENAPQHIQQLFVMYLEFLSVFEGRYTFLIPVGNWQKFKENLTSQLDNTTTESNRRKHIFCTNQQLLKEKNIWFWCLTVTASL